MPSPLNRIPQGLLEFFGIKSGEWGPRELGQVLAPTIDLSHWYFEPTALNLRCTISGNPWAADQSNQLLNVLSTAPTDLVVAGELRVPAGEVWLVLQSSIGWIPSAIDNEGQFYWTSGHSTSGFQIWPQRNLGYGQVAPPASAVARMQSVVGTRPFWVPPSHVIAMQLAAVSIGAGGTVSISEATLRLQRFRI